MIRYPLLIGAFALAAFLKFNAFWQAPGFEKNERTLYWTESAMHYYMADKVARGGELSELDRRAQYPEGIVLNHDIAPAMPWIAGQAYRLWPGEEPLDVFIGYFFILYSSLTVIAVYLWARMLFPNPLSALLTAYLYAAAAPSFIRSAGAFLKEDLALPALLLGFYLLLASFRKRCLAPFAGVLVALALLSWHFSQFVLLCFSAILIISVLVNGALKRSQALSVGVFAGVLAVAGAHPMLRATAFVFSPAMAGLYGVLVYHFAGRKFWAPVAVLASLAVYYSAGLAEQSHVFGLVIDKIRFGFVKPLDPTALSYETRSNWIEDFNSPSLQFLIYTVSFYLLLGFAGLVLLGWKTRERFFVFAFGLIFLFFFGLSRRMITIDIIFLCIAAGALTSLANRKTSRIFAAVLAAVVLYEGWKSVNYNSPNPVNILTARWFGTRDLPEAFTVANHLDLLNWLRANTSHGDPILASIGLSPVILAYASRPIIIHSMFDAKIMRDKVQAYIESLYSGEDQFYEFAKRHGARFFIYEARHFLMDGPNSDSYLAGNPHPASTSAVYKFHFHPEQLSHFQLVYQNTAYRVFALDKVTPAPALLPIPIYDERGFGKNAELVSFLQQTRELNLRGFVAGGDGNVPAAVQWWEELKRQAPYTVDVHAQLCLAYLITQNVKDAAENCELQMRYQPHSPVGHFNLALLYERTARYPEAIAELETALRLDPRYKKARAKLAQLKP